MKEPPRYIPPETSKIGDDSVKKFVYTGISMYPILKVSDKLRIVPYDGEKIRCGDVIVFIPPDGSRTITHRVISIDSQGIRTRGDNNRYKDPWILHAHKIIGRVVYAQKGNKWRRIRAGLMGRLSASPVRAICVVESVMSSLLRPVYLWLVRSGIFRKWLPGFMKIRVLSFNRPAGAELQLLMGRHVIGRLLPERDRWFIRPPFRLFVDDAFLANFLTDYPTIRK
jgi:signal peptidase